MKNLLVNLGCMAVLLTATVVNAQQVGTIGVGDITYSASSEKFRSKENIISALNSGINDALIKTRKFTVLDYAQLSKRLSEQGRNLQGFYNKEYDSVAFNQAGLDYILRADVTEVGLFEKKRGKSENAIGLVDVDFSLIGVADVTSDITSSVSAQFSTRVISGDKDATQDVLDKAIQKAVDQLVDQVISGLFPIRVMKIGDDGAITLNYGEGLLQAGDTVLVFPKDSDIVIDESGETVGEAVATLQVISAERKFSVAQALEGQEALEKGQKGHLLLTDG